MRDRVLVGIQGRVWSAWAIGLGEVTGLAHGFDVTGIVGRRLGVGVIRVDGAKRQRRIVVELGLIETREGFVAAAAATALLANDYVDLHACWYGDAMKRPLASE
jgi:hypothetical protein